MASIRVQTLPVFALVFDQFRVIFTIHWILLFIDRVNPASVFRISMRMIHLHAAIFVIALGQARKFIGHTYIYVKGIYTVIYCFAYLRHVERIIFYFKRRPDKNFEVLRKLFLCCDAYVHIYSFLYQSVVKVLPWFVAANVSISCKENITPSEK